MKSSTVLTDSKKIILCTKVECTDEYPTNNNKVRTFFTILFALYFGLTLFRFVFPANALVTSLVISLGITSLLYSISVIRRLHLSVYIFVILLICSHLISSLAVFRTERIGHMILFTLSNTGIAMLLIKKCIYSWGSSTIFYLLVFVFVLLIFAGFNPDENLSVVSHNGISMLIIVACVTLYVINFLNGKDLVLLPAVFTIIISIWGSGRSGILSSFIILLGLTLIKYKINLKYSFILGVCILLILFYSLENIVLNLIEVPFFTNAATLYLARTAEGGPDVRIDIWQNYIDNLDFYRIFFGVNVLLDPWPEGKALAYNYHNSYINLHLQTGFMGIVTILLTILALIKFFFKNQIFFILFFALSLRWLVDIGLYFESWDYLPFFFIFLSLIGKDFQYFLLNNKNKYVSIR